MLVSVDLRLLVLTRSDMDVARRASWFVPVLRTSELHGGRTARRPTLFQYLVHSFFSCVVAPSCLLRSSEHRVAWYRSLSAGLSCDGLAWRSCAEAPLRAAEATRVHPRTQRAVSSNSIMFFFGTKNRSELVSSPRKEGAFSDMDILFKTFFLRKIFSLFIYLYIYIYIYIYYFFDFYFFIFLIFLFLLTFLFLFFLYILY